jgi:GxxExxY protein
MPINEKDYAHSEITRVVIGSSMTVHSKLGNGFQEVIYQRALAIEFDLKGILYSREHEMPIYYNDREIGTRRVDFLIEGKVSVELKALTALEPVHLAPSEKLS